MKKESAAWNVAATHFLTAGFLIPLVTSLALGFILSKAGMDDGSLPIIVLSNAIVLVSVWLGVMYSANYLAKKYVVTDVQKIVTLSTVYMVVLFAIYIGGSILVVLNSAGATLNSTTAISVVLFAIVRIVVFYIASKKYIQQDAVVAVNY